MRRLPVLALLMLLNISAMPAAMAQSRGAECTAIAVDTDRLACFDAAFAAPEPGVADSVTFQSEQLIPARPSGRQPATITIACMSDILTVAFSFAGNTLSQLGNDAGITWQLDLQAARSRTLPVNPENTAILLNNTADSLAFIQSTAGANNLTVRVTPASSRSLSVRYSLADFADRVAPVRAACGV